MSDKCFWCFLKEETTIKKYAIDIIVMILGEGGTNSQKVHESWKLKITLPAKTSSLMSQTLKTYKPTLWHLKKALFFPFGRWPNFYYTTMTQVLFQYFPNYQHNKFKHTQLSYMLVIRKINYFWLGIKD